LLFRSDDGRRFGSPLLGFDALAGYPGTGVSDEPGRRPVWHLLGVLIGFQVVEEA